MIGPRYNLNLNKPVNEHDPLNRGLLAWFLAVPPFGMQGPTWRDLKRAYSATFVSVTQSATSGWAYNRLGRRGYGQFIGDGTGYLDAGDSFGGLAAMTISCWVRFTNTPAPGAAYPIISKFGNNGSFDSTDAFDLFYDGNFNLILGGPNVSVATTAFAIDTPHFVVAVYDGAAITIYVDTLSAGTGAASGTINAAAGTNARIGDTVGATFKAPMQGWIDDIRIYNRALSATEAFGLYRASILGYPTQLNRSDPWIFGIAVSNILTAGRVNMRNQAVNAASTY